MLSKLSAQPVLRPSPPFISAPSWLVEGPAEQHTMRKGRRNIGSTGGALLQHYSFRSSRKRRESSTNGVFGVVAFVRNVRSLHSAPRARLLRSVSSSRSSAVLDVEMALMSRTSGSQAGSSIQLRGSPAGCGAGSAPSRSALLSSSPTSSCTSPSAFTAPMKLTLSSTVATSLLVASAANAQNVSMNATAYAAGVLQALQYNK